MREPLGKNKVKNSLTAALKMILSDPTLPQIEEAIIIEGICDILVKSYLKRMKTNSCLGHMFGTTSKKKPPKVFSTILETVLYYGRLQNKKENEIMRLPTKVWIITTKIDGGQYPSSWLVVGVWYSEVKARIQMRRLENKSLEEYNKSRPVNSYYYPLHVYSIQESTIK